ncbi:hypothetical protein EYF80_017303 [Liparis tanakae]|uniref:Uncharacterized protein n=1 Tax=Liparis tanakae TaxID=230148 RepID=A0A4Z2I3G9_9TELE|nr:hypothetical protein EYF80_017303 [Liparis tanakae]
MSPFALFSSNTQRINPDCEKRRTTRHAVCGFRSCCCSSGSSSSSRCVYTPPPPSSSSPLLPVPLSLQYGSSVWEPAIPLFSSPLHLKVLLWMLAPPGRPRPRKRDRFQITVILGTSVPGAHYVYGFSVSPFLPGQSTLRSLLQTAAILLLPVLQVCPPELQPNQTAGPSLKKMSPPPFDGLEQHFKQTFVVPRRYDLMTSSGTMRGLSTDFVRAEDLICGQGKSPHPVPLPVNRSPFMMNGKAAAQTCNMCSALPESQRGKDRNSGSGVRGSHVHVHCCSLATEKESYLRGTENHGEDEPIVLFHGIRELQTTILEEVVSMEILVLAEHLMTKSG